MKKKNLLALFLSLMMATSTTAAFAACGDDDSSSSSSSSSSKQETETEELSILNSDFETYDDNDGAYPMVTNVEGWTWSRHTASSGTAIESKSASGIIDTQEEAWAQFTTSKLPEGKTISYYVDHVSEIEEIWDTITTKDKVEFYEAWEDKNPKKDIEDELDFYESLNVTVNDLLEFKGYDSDEAWATIENPGTHWGAEVEENEEYDKTNTKVLMLRNNHSSSSGDFIGTAAKFTSTTSVTVEAGTMAEFSVWVKTANLRDERNELVVDKGAYIQITHALGSQTQEPLIVKNINTEGVTENNGWVKYSFVLKGSPFTSSSFTIVLGLGMTGGSNRLEYVNGVAFFDDITCKTLELTDDYQNVAGTTVVKLGGEKEFPQNENVNSHFTIDFTDTLADWNVLSASDWDIAPTTEKRNDRVYSSVAGKNPYHTLNGGFNADKDITGIFESVGAALNDESNSFASAAYKAHFNAEDHTYLTNEQALVLFSARGAAHTAKSPAFTLEADKAMLYSFFVKTSEMDGLTGATIKLVDNESNPSIALDSTTVSKIEIDEKDIHDGWVQCFFFVHNDSGMDIKDLHFEFSYGPTAIIDTAKTSYKEGFAVFTNFQTKEMTKEEFDCAASNDTAKAIILNGEINVPSGDSGFSTPVLSELMDIENGYALPTDYTGVYNDSVLVGGTSKATNGNPNAGLLDSEYKANYTTLLNGFDPFSDPVYAMDATRPLVIQSSEKAYGFVGASKSVSMNSTTAISLRVKVSAGATANVYLVDTKSENASVLSVERGITYWYDEDGNILSKNPASTDEKFSERLHTAFIKQSNGLYKVNPTWEHAKSVDADAYYANLAAYEYDEKSGNLLLDSKTTYAYSDDWKHDGNDGYAFYGAEKNADGKVVSAYAYSNKTTKVIDLSTVANLKARYEAKTSNGLSVTIGDTNGCWAEVIFYVTAGSTAKSYRLEVWNGSRDASQEHTSTTGFVAFDVWSVNSTGDDVTNWLADAKEANETESENYFENVFSFYDSAQYLRYDATLDHNEVGDAFASYVSAGDGSEEVAYLYEEATNTKDELTYKTYTTYANFAPAETTQDADPVTDNSTDDSDDDNDDEDDSDFNVWMLASSIAVAAVLLFTVISLLVRKIRDYLRRKRGVIVQPTRLKKDKKTK